MEYYINLSKNKVHTKDCRYTKSDAKSGLREKRWIACKDEKELDKFIKNHNWGKWKCGHCFKNEKKK